MEHMGAKIGILASITFLRFSDAWKVFGHASTRHTMSIRQELRTTGGEIERAHTVHLDYLG